MKKYNYLILGLSKSGWASFDVVYNKKSRIYLYDVLEETRQIAKDKTKLMDNVFVLKRLSNSIIDDVDVVILSPAICLDNKYLLYAKKCNKKIISELELGFTKSSNDYIAITGTNGKTTTTTLVGHILSCAKVKNSLVGNIGTPVCKKLKNHKDTFVCEVSSFQLESSPTFRAKISAVVNIGVDHIDHHKTLKNYVKAKYNIAKNLAKKDCLVLNNNCPVTKKLATKTCCKVYYFDTDKRCFGCYQKNNNIYINLGKKELLVMPITDIKLIGKHNLENVLCAILCCYLYGVKISVIKRAVSQFEPLPHRLQKVCVFDNVTYINDSKATNIDSTLVATRAISSPILLILCGNDKGYEYDELFKNLPNNISKIVGCGGIKDKLKTSADKYNCDIVIQDNLYQAVKYCVQKATSGDTVLLSPSSASFDEFKNYQDRGNKFADYIKELIYER